MSDKKKVRGRVYGEVVDLKSGELISRLVNGKEVPFGGPVGIPLSVSRVDDTLATVRRLVHSELLRARADAEGFDSPEEADDFDLPDDPLDPLTPYEEHFMPPPAKEEVQDGNSAVVEGGAPDDSSGARKSGAVGKGKSKPVQNASDHGGVSEAAGDDPPADK